MNTVIKVENISKAYRLGEINTGTLGHDLYRWWSIVRGKEDPFLKVGEVNDRTLKGKNNIVWSLKDINFEIKQGDAVGIIGRNGAGKSTLLKLLSRITVPTTGMIKAHGRIASLLEVGTGFHPELTGKENIFLNGAILGMRRKEIVRKFDEIVDFSGVERYINTPVKRYSSGMYVRLAFAVAAYLESEILIVDEILAVGDAEFQRKCLGKMSQVSKGEGRTVLFVSHNLHSVKSFCQTGIYLKHGNLILDSNIDEVIKKYSTDKDIEYTKKVKIIKEGKKAWLTDLRLLNEQGEEYVQMNSSIIVEVEIEATSNFENIFIGLGVNDSSDTRVITLFSKFYYKAFSITPGKNLIRCKVQNFNLKPDLYKVDVFIGNDSQTLDYYDFDNGLQFEVYPSELVNYLLPDSSQGSVLINQAWF